MNITQRKISCWLCFADKRVLRSADGVQCQPIPAVLHLWEHCVPGGFTFRYGVADVGATFAEVNRLLGMPGETQLVAIFEDGRREYFEHAGRLHGEIVDGVHCVHLGIVQLGGTHQGPPAELPAGFAPWEGL